MVKKFALLCMFVGMLYGVSEAQVTPGTVFSKTLDGNGNKILSSGGGLNVNVISGGGGPTYLDADGIANQTASAVHGQTYMYNGVTWDRVRGSIAGGLEVNCVTGCAGGSSTPTDAFANPTTAGLSQTFNMGWNGASWDRLRSSIANGLEVDITNASLTVTTNDQNTIDSGNSSTTPLGIAGVFTGTGIDLSLYRGIAVNVFSDVDSGTDGLSFQWSSDNTNWDIVETNTFLASTGGRAVVLSPRARFFRVVYTNGGTGQATFRLQTVLYPSAINYANRSLGSPLTVDMFAQPVQAVMRGFDGTSFNTLRIDTAGVPTLMNSYNPADGVANNAANGGRMQLQNGNSAHLSIFPWMYNGTDWDRVRGSATDGMLVNLGTNNDVTVTSGSITVSNSFLLDATFTGRFAAAYADADTIANQTTTAVHGQSYFYNGTTWDRMRGSVADGLLVNLGANNDITVTSGSITATNAFLLDATYTGRMPAGASPADNESNTITTLSRIGTFGYAFDGATWDRIRGDSTDGLLVNLGVNNDVVQTTASNLNMRPDTSGATGAAPPSRADFIGGLSSGATGGLVQGIAVCDTFVNVNVSTATTTLLVTGVSGRHVRICAINLVTVSANTVALISGTGATCGTGTTGMNGGTTAATGWSFAATGGLTQGSGLGMINQTNATGDSVCIVTGAATQLSGRIAYTIY